MDGSILSAKQATQWRAKLAALLLLLVPLAQAASVVHAEEHLFHDAEEFCVAFLGVDKPPVPAGMGAAPAQTVFDAPAPDSTPLQTSEVPRKAYLARAPPQSRKLTHR